jgi:NADPH:quinone reductase-like Zn-dependent oxidoreductase
MKQLFQMLWTSVRGGKRVICALSSEKPEDLLYIKGLVEAGKIKSIIDKRYPMEDAAEAHRYIEKGSRTGSVTITIA